MTFEIADLPPSVFSNVQKCKKREKCLLSDLRRTDGPTNRPKDRQNNRPMPMDQRSDGTTDGPKTGS